MLTWTRDHAQSLKETLGTLNQKISSCLQLMERFLSQKEATIVSSTVIAEKRSSMGNVNNIFSDIADILGIKQNTIPDHATMAELGMDSLVSVQIKRIIEKEFDSFLTDQDLRSMTFGRLREIKQSKESNREGGIINESISSRIQQIFICFGDEETSKIPVVKLPSSVREDLGAPSIFCFPGIDGCTTTLKPLAANLRANIVGFQYCYKNPTDSYSDLAVKIVVQIEKLLEPKETFHFMAYSWGVIIALEVIAILEKRGYDGTLICLDGSPTLMREIYEQDLKGINNAELQVVLLCHLMNFCLPNEMNSIDRDQLLECNSFEERLELAEKLISKGAAHSPLFLKKMARSFYTRLRELENYTPAYHKIQSAVRLFKASTLSNQIIAEDYGLGEICDNIIEVKGFEGDHINILENEEVAQAINEILKL